MAQRRIDISRPFVLPHPHIAPTGDAMCGSNKLWRTERRHTVDRRLQASPFRAEAACTTELQTWVERLLLLLLVLLLRHDTV
jgi:hypothetical protein